LSETATLADAETFLHSYFEKAVWPKDRPAPLSWSHIPSDCGDRIRRARRRFGLTQAQFAARVGAARKAVVYQWESRQRCLSPLFWQRILEIEVRTKSRLDRDRLRSPSCDRPLRYQKRFMVV
jgi:ribosome-binding protein aMBF1 (putative translation factor)